MMQLDLFSFEPVNTASVEPEQTECLIFDWEKGKPVLFNSIKG